MMNELKRQAYLRAMDIQVYFPRMNLAGAKSSPAYDLPLDGKVDERKVDERRADERRADERKVDERRADERRVDPPLMHVRTTVSSLDAVKQLRSIAASSKEGSVSPIRPALPVSSESKDAEQAPDSNKQPAQDVEEGNELRFKLLYFKINEKLAVIDEVPHQASDRLNKESLILLKAILKALGQDTGEEGLATEIFSWPLLTSGYSMKNSPSVEAGKALSGFLQMRQETDDFSNLLVFAGQVENLLLKQESADSRHDFDAGKGYFITVTSSLHSILAVPALKREVWQQLQTLRKRIGQSI